MLVYTGSVVDGKTEVLCSVCKRVVGEFTHIEIANFVHNLNAIYCFDCDGVNADTVHSSVYDESGRYLICYDGTWVSVNLEREVRAKDKIIKQRNMTVGELFDRLRHVNGGKRENSETQTQ